MTSSPAFRELKSLWEDGLGTEVRRTAISFLALIAISLAVFLALPELRERTIDQIINLMLSKDVLTDSGQISFLALFANNLQACVFIMLYGLFPYISFPALPLGINAGMLGVMAAHAIASGQVLPFLVGVLPHGIIELPAMVLAISMGLYVCGQVTRRCRQDKTARSFLECLVLISRFLFLLLVPMLVVAALIEAWVTPALLTLFQSF